MYIAYDSLEMVRQGLVQRLVFGLVSLLDVFESCEFLEDGLRGEIPAMLDSLSNGYIRHELGVCEANGLDMESGCRGTWASYDEAGVMGVRWEF